MSYFKLKSIKFNGVDVQWDKDCKLYPLRR